MTLDLTAIAIYLIGGLFSLLGAVATYLINTRMKDTRARADLASEVKNSLGMMHQVSVGVVDATHPDVTLPGVSPKMAAGVQYVLDHAGAEATRFGVTQKAIAQKINAQVGLTAIAAGTHVGLPPLGVPILPIAEPLPVPPFLARTTPLRKENP